MVANVAPVVIAAVVIAAVVIAAVVIAPIKSQNELIIMVL
jgi:hypothetical protein